LKILGIIPVRGGSKGIPGKNIKILGDKPLFLHVANDAKSCNKISRLIVSTEDTEIARVAQENELDIPFLRPKELALDTTPTLPVILHVIETLEKQGEYYDAICLLQATSPFKPKGFIDSCIDKFAKAGADSFISVLTVPHEYNPHWIFEPDDTGNLRIVTGDTELVPRRQELPTAYYRDGSVYITSVPFLKSNKKLVGGKISFLPSDPTYYCNLDTMADWNKAELLFETLKNTKS
jgi:N-acylneuraminate cytidylyltransferase